MLCSHEAALARVVKFDLHKGWNKCRNSAPVCSMCKITKRIYKACALVQMQALCKEARLHLSSYQRLLLTLFWSHPRWNIRLYFCYWNKRAVFESDVKVHLYSAKISDDIVVQQIWIELNISLRFRR